MRDYRSNETKTAVTTNQLSRVSPWELVSDSTLPQQSLLEFQQIYLKVFKEKLDIEATQTRAKDFLHLYRWLSLGGECE